MEFRTKAERRAYLTGLNSPNLYGDGDYVQDYVEEIKRQILNEVKKAIPKGYISEALGFGDYEVSHNTLTESEGKENPKIGSVGESGVRVRHREYIQNIVTGAAGVFTLQSFPLNPGLRQVFPWLSQIASGFEEYRINGMIWEFKSTSSDVLSSVTTALGSVIMATEYDASRPVFANQQQMANHEFATTGRQSQNMAHAIECKKSVSPINELWIRTGSVPNNDDERLYDFGLFQIATVGQQGSSITVGELWVSYDITFFKPQLISGLGLELLTDHFYNTTGVTSSAYFGTGAGLTAKSGSNLGCTLGNTTITFPTSMSEGNFLVTYMLGGNVGSVVAPGIAYANCSALNIFVGDTTNSWTNGGSASTVVLILIFAIQLTGQNAKVTFSGGTLPSGITSMELTVNQLNGNVIT